MSPVPKFVLVALVAVGVIAAAGDAFACSCMEPGPPCQNAFQSDAVFAGTVVGITRVRDPGTGYISLSVEFAEVESFRELQGPTVSVLTATDGAACGYGFKTGERYIVYAARRGRTLSTSICSRTGPIAEAAADLQFFKSAKESATRSVFGSVVHTEFHHVDGRTTEHGPVADVLVALKGPAGTIERRTDGFGRYRFENLDPGTYEVQLAVPTGFRTFDSPMKRTLSDPRACFEENFVLAYDGRVRGTVESAPGEAAAGIRLELIHVEQIGKRLINSMTTISDDNGQFNFDEVPQGTYVLGVDHSEDGRAFPRTFYPGTSDAAQATRFEMLRGDQYDLRPLLLPAPLPMVDVAGRVISANGLPASPVEVVVSGEFLTETNTRVTTKADGTFVVRLHEGVVYTATARHQTPQRGRRRESASAGPFVATEKMSPLVLIFAGAP